MKVPPADRDLQLVHAALVEHWRIRSPELPYLPLAAAITSGVRATARPSEPVCGAW
jgi:hypothetical protein